MEEQQVKKKVWPKAIIFVVLVLFIFFLIALVVFRLNRVDETQAKQIDDATVVQNFGKVEKSGFIGTVNSSLSPLLQKLKFNLFNLQTRTIEDPVQNNLDDSLNSDNQLEDNSDDSDRGSGGSGGLDNTDADYTDQDDIVKISCGKFPIKKVWTAQDLNNVRNNLSGSYIQMADIDLGNFSDWEPIGNLFSDAPFTGCYDGQDYKIKNLHVNKVIDEYHWNGSVYLGPSVNIFGHTSDAKFYNLNLEDIIIQLTYTDDANHNDVDAILPGGVFISLGEDTKISNLKARDIFFEITDNLSGGTEIIAGNLIGELEGSSSSLTNVSVVSPTMKIYSEHREGLGVWGVGCLAGKASDLNVKNVFCVGSLIDAQEADVVGGLFGDFSSGNLVNAFYSGTIKALSSVGGLIGSNQGDIYSSGSYAEIEPSFDIDSYFLGGLIGNHAQGAVKNSFSKGNIGQSWSDSGGLVGANNGNTSTVFNSYSLSNIGAGGIHIGGMMGENSSGFVSNSYSTGFVDDTGHKTGGFTGTNGENGLIENSVYNIEISGQSYGCGGNQNCSGVEGVTTNGMKQKANFPGWDFSNIWTIVEGITYPVLRNQFSLTQWARWPMDDIYEKNGKQYTSEKTNIQKSEALVNGASLANGKVGSSLFFRRSEEDYVDTLSDFDLYNSFAISTWLRLQQDPEGGERPESDEYYVLLSKNKMPNEKSYAMFLYSPQQGQIRIYFVSYQKSDGTGEVFVSTVLDNPTVWNHVVANYDGEKLELFINGVQKTTKNVSDLRPADIESNLIIGAQANTDSQTEYSDYMWGSIDDVRMYHRPLLQDEITVLANGFN